MAAVPVTIRGVFYPDQKDADSKPIRGTMVGFVWVSGLKPDHGLPGDQPHPEHPIVLPPVDQPPPETPLDKMVTMVAKEPPATGGWGWFPEYGWMYKPSGATPKK